jgi:small subunit ribosomal protein S17
MSITTPSNKKVLTGVVVSDKMQKTIVVKVDRFVKHPKYGKFYTVSKKMKAHVAGEMPKIGDKVIIRECPPVAKTVAFEVIS